MLKEELDRMKQLALISEANTKKLESDSDIAAKLTRMEAEWLSQLPHPKRDTGLTGFAREKNAERKGGIVNKKFKGRVGPKMLKKFEQLKIIEKVTDNYPNNPVEKGVIRLTNRGIAVAEAVKKILNPAKHGYANIPWIVNFKFKGDK